MNYFRLLFMGRQFLYINVYSRSFSRSVTSYHGSVMLCQNAPDFSDSYRCKKVSAFFSVVVLASSEFNMVHFRFFFISINLEHVGNKLEQLYTRCDMHCHLIHDFWCDMLPPRPYYQPHSYLPNNHCKAINCQKIFFFLVHVFFPNRYFQGVEDCFSKIFNFCFSVAVVMVDIIMHTFVMWKGQVHGASL